jgi:hypothetical protein
LADQRGRNLHDQRWSWCLQLQPKC